MEHQTISRPVTFITPVVTTLTLIVGMSVAWAQMQSQLESLPRILDQLGLMQSKFSELDKHVAEITVEMQGIRREQDRLFKEFDSARGQTRAFMEDLLMIEAQVAELVRENAAQWSIIRGHQAARPLNPRNSTVRK